MYIEPILVGYRRQPAADVVSPFELMFGAKPRFSAEPPIMNWIADNESWVREFEVAVMKVVAVSQLVLIYSPSEPIFKPGNLLMRGRKKKVSKLLREIWSGPFAVRKENHSQYILRTRNK